MVEAAESDSIHDIVFHVSIGMRFCREGGGGDYSVKIFHSFFTIYRLTTTFT